MPLVVKDRVKETTVTTGTGTVTLSGAVSGYQPFSVIGDGNTTFYAIVDGAVGAWEVGIGTYTSSGTTLSRTTVLESSNAGSLVSFGAGAKEVFCTYPAERSMYVDGTTITPATAATLPVVSGGTGAATLTANNVLLGNGTSALQAVAPGTTGNVLTSNGTTWTSAPSGGGGGTLAAIATGSLSDGSKVVINADGTVSVVAILPDSLSAETTFDATSPTVTSAVYDSVNNKVVIAYGISGAAKAIVGTVSGSSITFGTAVTFHAATTEAIQAVYNSVNNKVIIAYTSSTVGRAIVGTVSGTSISFGTMSTIQSGVSVTINGIAFDSTNGKVVIVYTGLSNAGTAIVGTVSDTDITFGAQVIFVTAATSLMDVTYDSVSSKVIIAFANASGSRAIVGTVSGTSISFGGENSFSSSTANVKLTFDSTNNKIVIMYRDSTNSNRGTAVVGTVSGTSVSYGTPVIFSSQAILGLGEFAIAFDSINNAIALTYRSQVNALAPNQVIFGKVTGTNIVFNTAIFLNGTFDGVPGVSITFDPQSGKCVIPFALSGGKVKFFTYGSANLTAENYIGISNGSYANGATATVQIVGSVDDAQSGLTAGQSYYVQLDGTLALTPATPSVFAGTAVSATKLIVKG